MKRPIKGVNDFETLYPEVAKEWHPTKNGDNFPSEFLAGSNKKVWWKCNICGYEWEASIYNRGKGRRGCSRCKKELHTSFPEQAILYYLSKIIEVKSRFVIYGQEADIFIPCLNTAIEYEGFFFHERDKKIQYDINKQKIFKEKGVRLIRVVEHREKISTTYTDNEIHCFADQKYKYIKEVISFLCDMLQLEYPKVDIDTDYSNIMQQYIFLAKNNSLLVKNPNLAQEWHPTRNGNLTPEQFQCSSSKYIWWLCPQCGYEWSSKISNRNRGKGCPVCNQYAVTPTNNLEYMYPNIAKEWHPTKNGMLLPKNFLPGSNKKVWWMDERGNEWYTQIRVRVFYRAGAPQDRGKKAGKNRVLNLIKERGSFKFNYPEIANNWDNIKNTKKPEDFLDTSHEMVYWKCEICGVEWRKEIRQEVKFPHKCKFQDK